jgi:hypothetical protein
MKLYRLEETIRPTKKKPYKWFARWMNGYKWESIRGGTDKEKRDAWVDSMDKCAALMLGVESESVRGCYCTYFLTKEVWPENIIEDLVNRVASLESDMRSI